MSAFCEKGSTLFLPRQDVGWGRIMKKGDTYLAEQSLLISINNHHQNPSASQVRSSMLPTLFLF